MTRSPLSLLLGALLAFGAADASAQKLYRWVDKDGKVHYGDQVPPDAIDQGRETLNQQGMTVDRVDRALTAEERAEQQRAAAEQAAQAEAKAEQDKLDGVLLASYQSEGDLQRSFQERFDLLEQSLESARIGIQSQQKSLADLLAHAAELERNGRPIGSNISGSIATARKQVVQQREFLAKREAERVAVQQEFDTTLARYRALQAPAQEG